MFGKTVPDQKQNVYFAAVLLQTNQNVPMGRMRGTNLDIDAYHYPLPMGFQARQKTGYIHDLGLLFKSRHNPRDHVSHVTGPKSSTKSVRFV